MSQIWAIFEGQSPQPILTAPFYQFLTWAYQERCENIVLKGISTLPSFQNYSPVTRIHSFLKIPHPPTLSANPSSQVFLTNRNTTVKLSSINTIHVKQQHNVGFFIFKFTPKFMLGNVYINKIHVRHCLYIIRLYCREGFFHSLNFFFASKGILHIFKTDAHPHPRFQNS